MIDKIGLATKYLKKDIANQQSDPDNDGGAESAHSEVESGTIGQPVTDPESGVEQSDVNQTENCGDIGEKGVDIIDNIGPILQQLTDPESAVEQDDVNQTKVSGDIGDKDMQIIDEN